MTISLLKMTKSALESGLSGATPSGSWWYCRQVTPTWLPSFLTVSGELACHFHHRNMLYVQLAFHRQSRPKVERHGCSQGFHITFPSDSWFSTGFTVLLCASTASPITLRMAWKAGSVSGVSGVLSDGSRDRSKSSGGLWYVTWAGVQKQTCVWKQPVAFFG